MKPTYLLPFAALLGRAIHSTAQFIDPVTFNHTSSKGAEINSTSSRGGMARRLRRRWGRLLSTRVEVISTSTSKSTYKNSAAVTATSTATGTGLATAVESSIATTMETSTRHNTATIHERGRVSMTSAPAPDTHVHTCTDIFTQQPTAIPAQTTSTPRPTETPYLPRGPQEGLVLGLGLGLPCLFIFALACVSCPNMAPLNSLSGPMMGRSSGAAQEAPAGDGKDEELESVVVVPAITYQRAEEEEEEEEEELGGPAIHQNNTRQTSCAYCSRIYA
ncbi:hypothetical protein PSPO01_02777 [Paraphaeosphaeria sporulosa]